MEKESSKKSASQKKMMYIVGAVVLVVILAVGGFFFMNQKKQGPTTTQVTDPTQNVKMLKPEDIGLVLTPNNSGKSITMEITKLDGVSSIEYDVSYDAQVTEGGETSVTPRGVVGSPIEVKEASIKRDIDLGTCSRNVCKYDKVVSDVKFTIKVNFKDGSVGSVEKSITIPGTDKSLDVQGTSGGTGSQGGDY